MKKIILYTISGLIIIFIVVTGYNTLTGKTKQPEPNPTDVTINEEKAITHLSQAITYKTISYQDRKKVNFDEFSSFIDFLQTTYPKVHENLELERINNYALIYKWKGTNSSQKPIGLTSHYDVVPVLEGTETNWEHEPFGGAVADGKIFGRGTLDDKIGVIGILEAVEYLLGEDYTPERDVYLMFGFDEEIGGELGAKAIAKTLQNRGIQLEFVLDEGGAIVENMVPGVDQPVAVIGIAEKGSAIAELTIEGSGGHSSQPNDHTNIGRIAAAIAKLEDTQFEEELRGPVNDLFEFVAPEMSFPMKYVFANKAIFKPIIQKILLKEPATAALLRTTIAPTIFQAGEQYNALPEKASAIINLRLMPGDSLEYVEKFIKETIDDEDIKVTVSGNEASKVSSVDSWHFKSIQQAARNVYKEAIVAPYLMFAGSDARHYDQISDNTYRFLPVLITGDDLNKMHGTNEQVGKENFINSIKFYVEIIKEAS
ncbi:M20 family peptidase [Caldifermentibacillus hisashii]|uniref:M20 family peptidase n=1 Tax=Caldifermentibacillus hisashii TaxID=996558 RepID=UPI001C0FB587|nr:M20 family peptidase [Caldifermentibacillus hisashii]MBU5344031.1 M20 family peptidase [Caldifermentibacillus hisashii]